MKRNGFKTPENEINKSVCYYVCLIMIMSIECQTDSGASTKRKKPHMKNDILNHSEIKTNHVLNTKKHFLHSRNTLPHLTNISFIESMYNNHHLTVSGYFFFLISI